MSDSYTYSNDKLLRDHLYEFLLSIYMPITKSYWRNWKTAILQSVNCGLLFYVLTLVVESSVNSIVYKNEEAAARFEISIAMLLFLLLAYLVEKIKDDLNWRDTLNTTFKYSKIWFSRLLLASIASHMVIKAAYALWS